MIALTIHQISMEEEISKKNQNSRYQEIKHLSLRKLYGKFTRHFLKQFFASITIRNTNIIHISLLN